MTKRPGPTYDQFLSMRPFLNRDIAEFQYNGSRLGDRQIASRSGSVQETRLTKRSEELLILALTLGWESARPIIIDDADGKMERPDFLVSIADQQIGAEVTTLRRPAASEGEAVVVQLNADVNGICSMTPSSLAFLADYTITCTLQRTPSGKLLNQLRTEIVDFVIDLMRSP